MHQKSYGMPVAVVRVQSSILKAKSHDDNHSKISNILLPNSDRGREKVISTLEIGIFPKALYLLISVDVVYSIQNAEL